MAKTGYQQFFEGINEVLERIQKTQGKNIEKAATIIADCIEQDGVIHVFGAGHSYLIAEEIFFRAGTLAPINILVDLSLAGSVWAYKSAAMEKLEGLGEVLYGSIKTKKEDVFLVISNSGRNSAQIELAREAQKHGHKVIAETSVNYSNSQPSLHSSGKRLLDYADAILDNCGNFGDVVVNIPDMKQGAGPSSGITGIYIILATLVEAAFQLKERGIEPPVFMLGTIDGAMEFNQKYLDKYWDRIRNW